MFDDILQRMIIRHGIRTPKIRFLHSSGANAVATSPLTYIYQEPLLDGLTRRPRRLGVDVSAIGARQGVLELAAGGEGQGGGLEGVRGEAVEFDEVDEGEVFVSVVGRGHCCATAAAGRGVEDIGGIEVWVGAGIRDEVSR